MKIAISIPDSIFEEADALAKRLGKSRSRLYADAVAEYLRDHRDEGVTEQLDAVYAAEDSSVDEALYRAQLDQVDDEGW